MVQSSFVGSVYILQLEAILRNTTELLASWLFIKLGLLQLITAAPFGNARSNHLNGLNWDYLMSSGSHSRSSVIVLHTHTHTHSIHHYLKSSCWNKAISRHEAAFHRIT